jgi:hypothetical protein
MARLSPGLGRVIRISLCLCFFSLLSSPFFVVASAGTECRTGTRRERLHLWHFVCGRWLMSSLEARILET